MTAFFEKLAECEKPFSKSMEFLDDKKCRNLKTAFWKKLKLGMQAYLFNVHILCHF